MRRREFIMLLGGAAAWPLAVRAQQAAQLPTVGFIGSDTPDAYAVLLRAFRVGLKATGFIEGQNVAIEYRWAEGQNDKLSEFAVDLDRRQVAVIVAPTTPSVLAAFQMPIIGVGERFDSEGERVLRLGFEVVCLALSGDGDDYVNRRLPRS